MAAIAERKLSDLDRLAEEGLRVCIDALPDVRADEAIREDCRRSMRANLRCYLEHLADGRPGAPAEPPPEAFEMATTILRRGGDPEMISRAYMRGPRWSLTGWLSEIRARVEDPATVLAVYEDFSRRYFDYMELAVDKVIEHYQRERRHWIDSASAHRAEIVRSVLDDRDGADVDAASRTLGFELRRPLVPAVLWSTEQGGSVADVLAGLEALATAIARDLGAHRALTAPAGSSTLWTWIGLERPLPMEEVAEIVGRRCRERQYVALGTVDGGLPGFRNGHQEAVHAHHVANTGIPGAKVFRYDELELVSLVAEEHGRMRRFVARTLGGLAEDDPAAARLRETLTVYFAHGANARSAAERLNVHKNTVLYRIRSAEDLLGRSIDERRLELELALKIAQALGDRALSPPS
ncbi:helix-turn-helix domain-containing protein [Conexibacter arvalis]|uniref:helix-turn-helix domain-containing protein n=1 Tax=Conexibacter arvalis TaxID=912552 RepID=UPI00160E21DE